MRTRSTVPIEQARGKHGRNRQLVLDALVRAARPMGAYELLELLREDGFSSPLQVYRALDQLIGEGAVHKIESLSAFAACNHEEGGCRGSAVFAICSRCGQASEIHDPGLQENLRRIALSRGFETTTATVELSGVCQACAHG